MVEVSDEVKSNIRMKHILRSIERLLLFYVLENVLLVLQYVSYNAVYATYNFSSNFNFSRPNSG